MKKAHTSSSVTEIGPFSPAQIHAFRLRRHHLLDRTAKNLVTICRDVCGVQAQIMSAAQLQFWARNPAITPEGVHDALFKTRSLVKTTLMRQTLHLVPADDFLLYIAAQKTTRTRTVLVRMAKFKITREVAEGLSQMILDVLKTGPAPRTAITAAVLPKASRRIRAWMAESWSMVRLPVAGGQICYGPGEGNQVTFIRTDQWLPRSRPVAEREAQLTLFRRYLRAYGPATLKDFVHWSGLSPIEVRELLPVLQNELAETASGLLLREDIPVIQGAVPHEHSVHLLPYFDVYLLAHSTKEHFLDRKHYKRVYRNQGWISPVVLINGEIAGVWSYQISRRQIDVAIELFKPATKKVRAQIEGRAHALAEALQRTPSISFTR
jgi:hypothetical protein